MSAPGEFIQAHKLPPLPRGEPMRLALICEESWRLDRIERERERRESDAQADAADRRRRRLELNLVAEAGLLTMVRRCA